MSRRALLDVNVLVALFDPDHVHHEMAHDWFADHRTGGWATCALTENGFLRVVSNPSYGGAVNRPAELLRLLRRFCGSGHHAFWADALSLRDEAMFRPGLIAGHRQISDVYLLGLATKMEGRLVTFDRSIALGAVAGATRANMAFVSAVQD